MPSPVNPTERIALQIDGVSHNDWLDIEVDADLLTPAAGWAFTVGLSQGRLPPEVRVGARAELRAGDALIMTGQVDELRHEVARGQHTLSVYGRDAVAVLVDCSAPLFSRPGHESAGGGHPDSAAAGGHPHSPAGHLAAGRPKGQH